MCGKSVNPKVFIIHASEDKDRFVLDFAAKLRSKGIDAWIDRWEMNPGDSLVDKVFEEGIKNAQAVIIVLSKHSVDKPWVREELNASMVKRINEKIKLIPVIIDYDCQVPECLKSTVWERIKDLNNYDSELGKIVASIYGQYDRPPLGEPPMYTQTIIDTIPNLTKLDSLVLKLSCEEAIRINSHRIGRIEAVLPKAKALDISEEEFSEALEILENNGYIRANYELGRNAPISFIITIYGFEEYSRVYIEDYDSIVKSVALQIVNNGERNAEKISECLDKPRTIIRNIIKILDSQGLISIAESLDGIDIYKVSPELKRRLGK